MKKILHIINTMDQGGAEHMLARTLPHVQGFAHTILTLSGRGALADACERNGVPVATLSSNPLSPYTWRALRQFVSRHKPDLIITYLFHADLLGRFLLSTVTAPIVPSLGTTYNHPRYFIARLCERLTKSRVRHYIANSPAVKKFYTDHIGVASERITIIPNGIDCAFFDAQSRDNNFRASFGFGPADVAIVCVANFHPNKRHCDLLAAFTHIASAHPHTQLFFIGDGTERAALEKDAASSPFYARIHFLGHRTDVPRILKNTDVFVLPTLFEGMSNAIMEAMAAGLPVITTDIPENRGLVDNGATGILVPPKDPTAIAKALQKILEDPVEARKYGARARRVVVEHFDLKKIAQKYTEFYTTLLHDSEYQQS